MGRRRTRDKDFIQGALAWAYMRRDPDYRAAWAAHGARPRFEAAAHPFRVQTEADLEAARDWALYTWEDPSDTAWRSPFWSTIPMLVAEPDPDPGEDGPALLPLLAAAGASVEGLRLLNGRFVLKVEQGNALLQILVRSGRALGPGDGIMAKLGLVLPLELTIRRIEDLWRVSGRMSPPRRREERAANIGNC